MICGQWSFRKMKYERYLFSTIQGENGGMTMEISDGATLSHDKS
jgi:hypothetical protein